MSRSARGPAVTAVVVNWNGAKDLADCLPSLCAQTYADLEILVVDNGSTDDSHDVVAKFPVKWVPLGENRGLAGALNHGARIATSPFVLFLNNDMRFDPRFVEHLARELDSDPTLFATDARQYNWAGTKEVHLATALAGGSKGDLTERLVRGLYLRQLPTSQSTTAVMASAANMMARRDRFLALSGFDERMPIGYEDVDICWRAWAHGWGVRYVPDAVCWHNVGRSSHTEEGAARRLQGTLRGRLLFVTKTLPAHLAARAWADATAGLALDLLRGKRRRVKARYEALSAVAKQSRALLRERAALTRSTGRSPSDVIKQLPRAR